MDRRLKPILLGAAAFVGLVGLTWAMGGPRDAFAQMCGGGMHGDSGGEIERSSIPEVAPSHGKWHHVRMHGFDWGEAARHFDKKPDEVTSIERGKYAVETVCADCHGRNGEGGVKNPNYENETVPRLDTLAESVGLFDKQKADKAIELLKSGADLDELRSDPPFDGFARFSVQIESMRKVIREGSEAAPEDPAGKDPVDMPSWDRALSESEIDGTIAYLLSLQDWDDGDGEK